MLRKVFKTGNCIVVSLPRDALELLDIAEGSDVSVHLVPVKKQIVILPVKESLVVTGVDDSFALQIAEFIARYRFALEALAETCLSDC